jgi:hypothetical protein
MSKDAGYRINKSPIVRTEAVMPKEQDASKAGRQATPDKKKRLADALRRNLLRRKRIKDADGEDKPIVK